MGIRWRPYRVECTGSLSTSEVKQRRARLVLGWGTAWEDLRVLSAFRKILCRSCLAAPSPTRPQLSFQASGCLRLRDEPTRDVFSPAPILFGKCRACVVDTLQRRIVGTTTIGASTSVLCVVTKYTKPGCHSAFLQCISGRSCLPPYCWHAFPFQIATGIGPFRKDASSRGDLISFCKIEINNAAQQTARTPTNK